MTTEERYLVLSALMDRETVDPDGLFAALDEPEGRSQLVDFARLRAAVDREFSIGEEPHPKTAPKRSSRWFIRAALVLLPLALGAFGGAWWVEQRDLRPPAPDIVVKFVPGVDWK